MKTTRSKAGGAAAASSGASKKKKTPTGEGVVKPGEKQEGDAPVATELVSSSNASIAEDKDEEEEEEEGKKKLVPSESFVRRTRWREVMWVFVISLTDLAMIM